MIRFCSLLFILFLSLPIKANDASKGLANLLKLPPFERAVLLIKHYEGWHGKGEYPYIGYGHRLQPDERLTYRITESQGDSILRADLLSFCALFREYGADSLLLACLSYNVGPANVLGNKKKRRSRLLRKLDAGNRHILAEYLGFCRWKGRVIPSIKRRRLVEYTLLFKP